MSDILGTTAAERLLGTAGNDTIDGNGGGDRIDGGRGDDVLTGGDDGIDTLFGEAGNDTLNGGGGADNLYGGMGDDIVHGGDGNDYIVRDEARGSDILYGEAGDDYIVVGSFKGSGASQAYGGDGNDYFTIDVRTGATVAIDGGAGDDWVDLQSWDAAATLTLGAGRDLITLETAATYTGTSTTGVTVTDFATGPGGDVLQIAEALIDSAAAWDGVSNPFTAGFLRLTQSGADTILDVSAQGNGIFTRAFVFKNVDASSFTAENFAGLPLTGTTSAPLTLAGSDLGDVLSGGAGDDVIDGGAGRDRIYGGFGADTLSGGDDPDRILGGAGNDVIDGGAGNDSLYGGFGDDVVHGGADNDFISDNDTGIDQLYGDDGNDQLWVQRDSWRSGGSVALYGGAGDDLLAINTNNTDPITADGGSGADRLHIYTLAGSVTAALGDGSDVIELGTWSKSATSTAAITISDFAAGDGGDRLDWYSFLTRNATGYVADSNPFTTGYARLVQSGADVLLQFDRDGPAATNGFVTLITFANTSLSAFTAFNLGGFSPDGSTPAAHAFTGTPDADVYYSGGGADTVDGAGGNDILYGAAGAQTLGGGDGNDLIHGGPGADVIDGGADNDTIYGEQGSDILTGGAGDDYLNDTQGAADSLSGGDGKDQIYIERTAASDSATVSGGDGDDLIQVNVSAGSATIDAGAGNDLLSFYASASTILTLGSGADTLSFYSYGFTPGSITITDFQAGDGGDRIDWDEWLLTRFTNFQPAVGSDRNPFSSGYAKLVQSGADAILQVDMSGSGTAYVNWITFKNTNVWSLSAYNFDGYETNFSLTHGTAADETFQGGTGNDGFDGGGGNDSFLIGYGGSDYAAGGSGDDSCFVALTSVAASHIVTGAGGNDLLQLQGHGAQAITLGTSAASGTVISASGIETVQLLASADSSRNWGQGAAAAYTLTLQDSVTPAGSALTIDASGLASVDTLTFSTTESDSSLHVIGGAGNDRLTGGALGDVLTGGDGNDTLDGGAGSDQLDGGAGGDSFNYVAHSGGPDVDTVTGGTGNDTLNVNFAAMAGPLTFSLTPDGLGGYSGWFQTDSDHRVEFSGIEAFTITGTNAAETIDAGDGPDILVGGGGDDVIHGYGNADLLTGGSGNDTLVGGAGNDTYVLNATTDSGDSIVENDGEGTDTVDEDFASYTLGANLENLFGTSAAGQTLNGNALANFLWGFTGNDVVNGLDGNDILKGDSGNDTLDGGAGADSMDGGPGNDVFYVDDVGDTVTEASSAGTDEVRTSLAAYTLGSNVENLTGLSNAGQILTGNGQSNLITGGSGNDVFRLEAGGNDIANGNDGDDSFVFGLGFNSSDRANGGNGNDAVFLQGAYVGTFNAAAFTSIETLVLMSAADTRFGSTGATSYPYSLTAVDGNVAAGATLTVDGSGLRAAEKLTFSASAETDGRYIILGGAAADSLTGGAGADTLDGGAGADSMSGGLGNDVYVVDSASDTVTELSAGGSDEIRTALAAYTLTAANVETLRGTSSSGQSLTAGASGQTLVGAAGADTLDDGGFVSTLKGGLGDDLYLVRNGSTGIVENAGEGNDTVRSYAASYTLGANLENLVGMLSTGQTLTGNTSDNSITGGSGDDALDGGTGADYLDGGAGSDVLEGGAGNDGLYDLAGATTTMRGGDGDDYIYYRRWYDAPWQSATIEAGDGNDRVAFGTFLAGGGATIDLGAGDDILYLDEKVGSELFVTTGAGRDTLQISGLMDGQSADVVVTDFQTGAGGDSIDWATAFPFAFGAHGYQAGTNPFAQGYARLEQVGNDTLLQISPNADGNFDTVLTFQNTSASAFTADNLGWPPFASQAAGANPSGTSGDDWLTGSNAGTFFHMEQGGDDLVTAGSGNDAFYFGAALTSADRIDGGGGADQLALQGDYSGGLTLGAGQLANIETLVVLPHDDFRFGGGGANPYLYNLTLTDDSVAAGQQLKVNASTLKAGENFTFDGSAETNGSFFLYGGKGVDTFTGGSGADVFFFVEDGRYAPTDHVDGGGGADAMVLRGDYNLTLSADSLVNVETVVFLSGTDARFYASGTDFHYSIATADNTVGAGVTMTFNGGALRGTETLSFDGSAETDGHMRIFGGAANDHIIGGGQSDLIFGGDGADILTGGGGADEFRFQNVSESSVSAPDKITDFTAGDLINLGRIDAIAGGGDDAFHLVGAFDGQAGELVLAQGADNVWTVSGDVDGNGQADFQIQVTVADGHLLGVSDFVL